MGRRINQMVDLYGTVGVAGRDLVTALRPPCSTGKRREAELGICSFRQTVCLLSVVVEAGFGYDIRQFGRILLKA